MQAGHLGNNTSAALGTIQAMVSKHRRMQEVGGAIGLRPAPPELLQHR
jgi:hypothetical protein